MYEHRIAYRHANGDVEGFKGTALSSPAKAKQDAMEQIRRKIARVNECRPDDATVIEFVPANVIERRSTSSLTPAEFAGVKTDWNCRTRY